LSAEIRYETGIYGSTGYKPMVSLKQDGRYGIINLILIWKGRDDLADVLSSAVEPAAALGDEVDAIARGGGAGRSTREPPGRCWAVARPHELLDEAAKATVASSSALIRRHSVVNSVSTTSMIQRIEILLKREWLEAKAPASLVWASDAVLADGGLSDLELVVWEVDERPVGLQIPKCPLDNDPLGARLIVERAERAERAHLVQSAPLWLR